MSYHLIGIKGIGMSALAKILREKGELVQGSDIKLKEKNNDIDQDTTVVYSSAISQTHKEMQLAKKLKAKLWHRSKLLNHLMEDKKSLLIAGTHGKTTVSSLLAHVLDVAGFDPSFAIGGILKDKNTNGYHGQGSYFVAEADESDGSFLQLSGYGAVITNIEKDHIDYWKSESSIVEAFEKFYQKIESKQHVFWCKDDKRLDALCKEGISYGFHADADLYAKDLSCEDQMMCFTIQYEKKEYKDIKLSLMGEHNVLNSLAVFGLALKLGASLDKIKEAFTTFSGIGRRLDQRVKVDALTIYDDYAHHPTEIKATLKALRLKYPENRIVACFQPHKYSRLKEFFLEFTSSFHLIDKLFITDVFAASEKPIEGISGKTLAEKISDSRYVPRGSLAEKIGRFLDPFDIFITLGAGDITTITSFVFNEFQKVHKKISLGLLFGGRSNEHEISITSAKYFEKGLDPSIYDVNCFFLDKQGNFGITDRVQTCKTDPDSMLPLTHLKKMDVCIPCFHGPFGEDGMIQGFLQTLNIPYVGPDYFSCALSMHKGWLKSVAISIGVKTAPFVSLIRQEKREDQVEKILNTLSFPVFIKPARYGSSIGIVKVKKKQDLFLAIDIALRLDEHIIAEQMIEGRELEVAVIGNEDIEIADPAEVLTNGQPYDYEKKYGLKPMETKVLADLSSKNRDRIKKIAKKIYLFSGCKGMTRIDFFLTSTGDVYLNESNPIPGFTEISLFPKMLQNKGFSTKKLIDKLVILALHKARHPSVV